VDLFNEEKAGGRTGREHSEPSRDAPLATRMRPRSIEEFVGQDHIAGEGRMLHRMIKSGVIGSLIFYGPPSSGKTTLAYVISREINAQFETINAVMDGVKKLKEIVERAEKLRKMNDTKTILFVDEIHRWNKAQQDALLPHLESGVLTLIGATTENPFYSLVGPLLSRCQLFELYPMSRDEVRTMIDRSLEDRERGMGERDIDVEEEARDHLAEYAGGDIRNALNALEVAVLSSQPDENGTIHIDLEIAKECIQKRNVRYDGTGDEHYHYASALIKSMRGSDPDAALYWMVAMLEGGEDPQFIFRRLFIFASEDIGLADPHALPTVNSAHESFEKTGMPEGLYFLSHTVLYLALAPKSNSTGAVFDVQSEIKRNGVGAVPSHLKDKTANKLASRYRGEENPSDDYEYPHNHPHHWVQQQYLPDELEGGWYDPGREGRERNLWQRLQQIIDSSDKDDSN
jgi:putative ATPase